MKTYEYLNKVRVLSVVVAIVAASVVSTVALGSPVRVHARTGADVEQLDNEMEFFGIVESTAGAAWTINGRTVIVDGQTLFKSAAVTGKLIKVHAQAAANGSLMVREIEIASVGDLAASLDDSADSGDDMNENSAADANDNSDDDMNDNSDDDMNDNSDDDMNDNADDDMNDNADDDMNDNSDDDMNDNSDDDMNDNDDSGSSNSGRGRGGSGNDN